MLGIEILVHLPYSPDHTSCNFCIFSKIKGKRGKWLTNDEEVVAAYERAVEMTFKTKLERSSEEQRTCPVNVTFQYEQSQGLVAEREGPVAEVVCSGETERSSHKGQRSMRAAIESRWLPPSMDSMGFTSVLAGFQKEVLVEVHWDLHEITHYRGRSADERALGRSSALAVGSGHDLD
ncbi:hypothetical protein EVAR_19408_1 [Eumeta japonica]|uniref:Histone-lysine N-methyltransferase SETMAR n=1 Tax=Eumeta variegata TaxID=151549 RepID=A0A4C1TRV1_EUMVA|nr:hypothetical protein EVAR_19408_1 [Eumeta japonica]